jgi:hypothetical protein
MRNLIWGMAVGTCVLATASWVQAQGAGGAGGAGGSQGR